MIHIYTLGGGPEALVALQVFVLPSTAGLALCVFVVVCWLGLSLLVFLCVGSCAFLSYTGVGVGCFGFCGLGTAINPS